MSENKLNWMVTAVLLAMLVAIVLVVAVRAQQPPAPAAVAGVTLTPAERADIESLNKDLQLTDAQFQLLQYRLKELQSSYQQTAAARSQRIEVARRDHKLDASYEFDAVAMQFVKRATVPAAAPAPASAPAK